MDRYKNVIGSSKKQSPSQRAWFIAKLLISTQRIKNSNARKTQSKRGVEKGFTDPSFSVGMSRGYSTCTPRERKESSSFSEYGPFYKESKLCEFLGSSGLYYWKGKNVIFQFPLVNTIAWYLDFIPSLVKEKFLSVEHVFVALSSYVGSFMTLTNFSKFRDGYRGYIKPELLNIEEEYYRLNLPSGVEPPTKWDVFNAKITGDTHPGIVTRDIAYDSHRKLISNRNKIKKHHVLKKATHEVINNWWRIGKGHFDRTSGTYCLGSREKVFVLAKDEFLKLRTVWIPEIIDIIVGSTWFEHLKEYWSKGNLFSSEIWLGHADQHQRFYRRIVLDEKFAYSYEFDGKEWETGVVNELIIESFNILRNCFRKGSDIDNHFKFIMDTMVVKKLILHNGNTFLITNGIPSGHAWTSIINSICNWIIWTSTIKNCSEFSREFKEDYELQIQGDDVCIHSNIELTVDQINKIEAWMLLNFNYRMSYGGKNFKKSLDPSGLGNACFLKRVINEKGMIDTPVIDIWEKILTGPEYSKCRNSRMTYLRRRLNDLAIFSSENKERLALYYSLIFHYPQMGFKKEKEFYRILFSLTNGFTTTIKQKLEVFFKLYEIDIKEFLRTKEYYEEYFTLLYQQNFLMYDSSKRYVDYWKERKKSSTVSQMLQNCDEIPLYYGKDSFKILHYGKRKTVKRRRRPYREGGNKG